MNQKKQIFTFCMLIGMFFFLLNDAKAQQKCGTDALMQQNLQDPQFAAEYQALQDKVVSELQTKRSQAPCATPLIIPIAVHFQSSTISNQCMIDATIAQIDQMNADFAGCNENASMLCDWITAGCDNFGGTEGADAMPDDGACIQFCLADQNLPAGETTIGGYAITAGDYNANNQDGSNNWQGYLNIYVGNLGGGVLGFVNFLGGGSNANNTQGASVLTSTFGAANFAGCEGVGTDGTFNGGATLTHEIGHWFGLSHTFGDNVADTPPQNNPNFGCPVVDLANCTTSEGDDYSGNFMDYVDDDCMFTFSQDQVDIMIATADDQANWATNSVSCTVTYPPCADQAGACAVACATAVTTPIDLAEDACGTITVAAFPSPDASGLVLDDDSDAIYTWSTGNYLSAGGAAITAPNALTSTNCSIETETYYLNVDCQTAPLTPTLDGGTYTITAYPGPPSDLTTFVTVSGEGTCNEPMLTPLAGCENFVTVIPDAGNPAFPVNTGDSGTASYTVTFTPDPNGPDCCTIGSTSEGEQITNGDFEGGTASWTEVEEVPTGTPNPAPFGIIGVSGGFLNGSSDAWFGGWQGPSYLTIEQNINIPSTCGNANLSFDYGSGNCDNAANVTLNVYIGGVLVGTIDCNNDATPLTFGPVDVIAAGVPTGATTIFIEGTEQGTAGGSIYIDNISLVTSNCEVALNCDTVVMADYDCGGVTCDEEITYNVVATGCDMTGATIELSDGSGNLLDSQPLGADGGAGTFGLQPCGDFEIVIVGAPACYIDAGGDVGPRAGTTDGTGTTDEEFTLQAVTDIPTLSQWGLITLALLLMTLGSVKMAVGSVDLAGVGNKSIPVPGGNRFNLPLDTAILRKAFNFTALFALIGFAICFAIFGAIFLPDVIGVLVAGPILAYLVHLLYLLESRSKK